jgi:hypothetical protein
VSAAIEEVEILNPNPHTQPPLGPSGCGIAVLTQNPNLGGDPPPHAGAVVDARITRTLIESPATGTGCGVFVFNFAPEAQVSATLSDNVLGGGLLANGGVSRGDAVYDSKAVVLSHHNLYRDDTPDACVSRRLGWNLTGGSGTPVPLQIPATERNRLHVHSEDDRIEGFTSGISATGGRRFFATPVQGPSNANSIELELLGTSIVTSACGGAGRAFDLQLAGASTANQGVSPGEGNTVRAVIRGVTGSGVRSNVFADVLGPNGAMAAGGSGNRLEIIGNARAFERTNTGIAPAPGAQFFTGAGQ